MDEKKSLLPQIISDDPEVIDSDLSEDNLVKIQEYLDSGLPGIAEVGDFKVAKMMDLYLSGQTYSQIASATRTSKVIIMYLSKKGRWCNIRQNYLLELEEGMKRRILESKLVSQDFRLNLVQMFHKKIGKKIMKYLVTDDEAHLTGLNLKEIDRYLKLVESLEDSVRPPKSDKGPAVGLNLGDGVTITKKGDNEVEITPKQRAISDTLQYYADLRREEEKKK